MAKPLVAIVGRPNVGKSTLFNRLIGERRAIVEDLPGTTRDRLYGETEWNGVTFGLIDTGGLQSDAEIEGASSVEIVRATQEQAGLALEEADLILFLVDAQAGITAGDLEVADLLRRTRKPIYVVANKAESRVNQESSFEFYELGLGDVFPVSAIHGMGIGDLLDAITEELPIAEAAEEPDVPAIAIVGRPNVGKSAILNAILGRGRQIVSPIPGTTRDAVDTELVWSGVPVVLIDTAGIRRRGRVERGIEKYSVLRASRAISRADVAILVLDATEPFTAQDLHVAGYVEEQKKGIVLVINKWDLIEKTGETMGEFLEKAREAFDFMPYAQVIFTSALTGQRIPKIMDAALEVISERNKRISTGELNRMLREALHRHPPPSKPGKWVKFYYVTQASVAPPTFVFFTNYPENVHFSYRRYLENTIREQFGFEGTPIVLRFRGRPREV
ncbi:ribosome biogenesis GTPase Der [Nitrolancea hollandica]|uniref:ribosome biogenesis GTPase Der n=1 Tax=Nitrolancea hollandica TaxID=1206749 RepID=UPI0002D5663A|nr:ribosome biogenesis GTPase Der [Nitrolancea hollandica]